MYTSETILVVRYAETDRMGVVHHSNYPIWFEAGRTDFIKKLGMPYSKIENSGVFLPVIELKCTYKGAARYEDRIIVKTGISKISYTRVVFCYEVYRNDESTLITTGETVHVWTDEKLKPVNIKKYRPELYNMLNSAIESRSRIKSGHTEI